MTKLLWDQTGERVYETGVSMGVLYPRDNTGAYPAGVAWNGITAVSESPSGAEASALYADNIKYLSLYSNEEFAATIEAYTYPNEFALCDGSAEVQTGVFAGQQTRKPFGLVYRTEIGNDTDGSTHGYKLHIIYNAMASPSDKSFNTINDSPEAITFSWELTTTPENMTGQKPVSSMVIDSTKADPTMLQTLEDELFGTALITANLPLPDAIVAIFTV